MAAGWTLLLAPFVLELVVILRSNHAALLRRLPDDALYYLEIATRLGRGEGFTFDGVNSTNGFHPLWQLLLVPGATAFDGGDASIRMMLVLSLVCALAAVLLVVRLVWRLAGPAPALVGGIVATQYALDRSVIGMEGAVVLLALAVLATALARADRLRTPGAAALAGVASAVLVLARLDLAPILLVVAAAIALRWRDVRRVAAWTGGLCAVGAPAALWWFASWGHVLSTSATVKRHWLTRGVDDEYGGRVTLGYARYVVGEASEYVRALVLVPTQTGGTVLARTFGLATLTAELAVLAVVAVAAFGWWRVACAAAARRRAGARRRSSSDAWALGTVLAVVAAKAVLDVVVSPLWARGWYSVPQQLAFGFLVGVGAVHGVRAIVNRSRALAILAVAVVGLLLVPANALAWRATHPGPGTSWNDQNDRAADWILARGPSGRYGALDAGVLGYRLDGVRTVVNLDGLVNDFEYVDLFVTDPPLARLFRATGTEIFVGRLTPERFREIADCGDVLWRSPVRIRFREDFGEVSSTPVRVIDVRGC